MKLIDISRVITNEMKNPTKNEGNNGMIVIRIIMNHTEQLMKKPA